MIHHDRTRDDCALRSRRQQHPAPPARFGAADGLDHLRPSGKPGAPDRLHGRIEEPGGADGARTALARRPPPTCPCMHLQFPSISAGTILRHGLRPIEPFSSETAARGRGSVRRCGKNGRGVVRVGLLRRPGAGACPNLLQRRPRPGSAASKGAEYQPFSFGAPARSVPLQQIWTTCAAAGPPGGSPRVPREGHHGSGGGRSRRPDRPGGPAGTRPHARARHLTREHVC